MPTQSSTRSAREFDLIATLVGIEDSRSAEVSATKRMTCEMHGEPTVRHGRIGEQAAGPRLVECRGEGEVVLPLEVKQVRAESQLDRVSTRIRQ